MNEIKLKLTIDGKEALGTLALTDNHIQKLYNSMKFGESNVSNFTTNFVRGFDNIRTTLQGITEAFRALNSMFATPIQAAIDLEQVNTSFGVLIGNVQQTKVFLDDLRDYGAKTSFTMPDLTQAAQTMLSFGITAENVSNNIRMLGDISGGNAQKLQSLSLAFSQIQSTGRLTGQDLLQLINAGFNPLRLIAQETGKSMGELKKDMEKGLISAEMVTGAMRTATQEGGIYYGMMEKQSETLGGKLSNLQDSIIKVQQAIGGSIAIALKPLISVMTTGIEVINNFSPAITGTIGAVTMLGVSFTALKVTGILPLIINTNILSGAMTAVRLQMALAPAGVGAFQLALAGLSATIKTLYASIGPVGWVIIGLTAIVSLASLFSSSADEAANSSENLTKKLNQEKGEFNQLANNIKNTNLSLDERKKSLFLMQQKYPEYLKNLDLEKTSNEKIAAAVNEATKAYEKKIRFRVLEDQYAEKLKAQVQAELDFNNASQKLQNTDYNSSLINAEDNISGLIDDLGRKTTAFLQAKIEADKILKMISQSDVVDSTTPIIPPTVTENKILDWNISKRKTENNTSTETVQWGVKKKELTNPNPKGDVREYSNDPRVEVDLWKEKEYQKVSIYANSKEMEKAIDEEASRRYGEIQKTEVEIKEQAEQAKLNAVSSALSAISAGVAKHTVLGKAAAIAQATINTYEAVAKALTVGPILGPILAGPIGIMGMLQVHKIMATSTPGYALGGRLEQGKSGYIEGYHNEIIAPEKTFVDIMRHELIPKVINVNSDSNTYRIETLFQKQFEKMNNWVNSFTFKQKGDDLYSTVENARLQRVRDTY